MISSRPCWQTGGTLGAGFLAALVVAKILTFAVSEASGFVGGPIFPTLFIGGTAGVLVHQVIPGVPLGLAFTCMLAAVPGALISAPFAMVLLAAFVTQVGALQTAPVLIAVVTAFLADGVGEVRRNHTPARAAPQRIGRPADRGDLDRYADRCHWPRSSDNLA